MSVVPTFKLELRLGSASTDWTDVSADVDKDVPIRVKYGIFGFGPQRRVASPGTLDFALDNSPGNSAGLRGYYTPGHADVRSGFAEGVLARFSINHVQDYYKFYGRLVSIKPTSGIYGDQKVVCRAEDYMADAARLKPRGLTVQTSQTANQLITTALTAADKQPRATSFDTGKSTFEFAFDEIRDDRTTLLQIFQNATNSELGELALIGDTDGGGTLRFFNRHARITTTDVLISMDDDGDNDDFDSLQAVSADGDVFNTITAQTFPRAVDTDTTVVLWTLQGDSKTIPVNDSITVVGYYRDPANEDVRVAGVDLVTPTTDDYTVSGVTQTDVAVTATLGGNSVEFVLTNNGTSAATLTALQARGSKVLVYEPAIAIAKDSDSINEHGDRPLHLPLKYQDDPLEGQDFADITLTSYKDDSLRVKGVSFTANNSTDLMDAALKGEPGKKIALTDSMLGLSSDTFFINGVSLNISKGRILKTKWDVIEAAVSNYWILNTSALDTDTILGF